MEAKKIKLEPKPQHNEKIGAKKNRKKTSKNRAKAIKRTKTKEKKKAKRILRILGSTNSTIIVSDLNEGVQIRCNSPAEVSNQFETESVTNEEIRHWIRTGKVAIIVLRIGWFVMKWVTE